MTAQVPRPTSRLTARLVLTIVGAMMGSFQFGYNVGVINAPESLIKTFINETHVSRTGAPMSEDSIKILWAVTASIFAIGGCVGGLVAGWWATTFGRRGGSLINVALGVATSIVFFTSKTAGSYEMIILGRVLVGIHGGLYTGLSPIYLSEISTANTRGAFGVLHQLALVTALLFSQILGYSELLGTQDLWNILLGLTILPCLVQVLILPFCPESPRFLFITKQNEKLCREALTKLRGNTNVEDEIDEIKEEMMSCGKKISLIQLFRTSSLRPPLMIGIVMQLSQQFCGINGVFLYSTNLFREVIGSETTARYTTSAVGVTMVLMTIVTVPLMDRLGRRTLHLTGLVGMAVFGVLITITLALRDQVDWFSIASIVCVLLYVVFFAVGPGSIPWLIVAELFSHDARPAAMSVCVLVNCLSSFVVALVFPSLQEALKDYIFLPFTVLLILFSVFTYFFLPETKGKTFQEVTAIWQKKEPQSVLEVEKTLDKYGGQMNGDKNVKYGSMYENDGFSPELDDSAVNDKKHVNGVTTSTKL